MPQFMAVTKHFFFFKLMMWGIFSAHSSQTKPGRGCVLRSLPSCPSADPSGFSACWGDHPTFSRWIFHEHGVEPELRAAEVLEVPAESPEQAVPNLCPPPESRWIPAAAKHCRVNLQPGKCLFPLTHTRSNQWSFPSTLSDPGTGIYFHLARSPGNPIAVEGWGVEGRSCSRGKVGVSLAAGLRVGWKPTWGHL